MQDQNKPSESPSSGPTGSASRGRSFLMQDQWSNRQWKRVGLGSIPWAMIAPHEAQAINNHCGQTLERLAQRGGLSHDEAIAVLENREWSAMDVDESVSALAELVARWETQND